MITQQLTCGRRDRVVQEDGRTSPTRLRHKLAGERDSRRLVDLSTRVTALRFQEWFIGFLLTFVGRYLSHVWNSHMWSSVGTNTFSLVCPERARRCACVVTFKHERDNLRSLLLFEVIQSIMLDLYTL